LGWKGFFDDPVPYGQVFRSGVILVLHIAVFVSATILVFRKKDILT